MSDTTAIQTLEKLKKLKKTPATGVRGMILDYGRTFRVTYGKPEKEGDPWYKDYNIAHPDMTVEITDQDAFFYEDVDGNCFVDMNNDLDIKMLEEIVTKKSKVDQE